MCNPYVKDGNMKLLPSFVCYADILGFSQMSMESINRGRGDIFLDIIRGSLCRAYTDIRREIIDDPEIADFNLKVFTDNIVLGFPISDINFDGGEPELGNLFNLLSAFQMNLAMDGFFIRGAISYGLHYMDDDIVFGNALIEAHSLDDSGRPPRIVLAESMKDHIKEHFGYYSSPAVAPQFDELLIDSDNEMFINYLNEAFSVFPDGDIFFECLERHKTKIEEYLERFVNIPHIRQKYEWVARYHNFICRDIAEKYPVNENPEQDPEYFMISENAQRTLEFLITNSEGVSPRRIDDQVLNNLS